MQSVFLLRTIEPGIADVEGRPVRAVQRVGKRIAIGVEGDCWLVLHIVRGEGLRSLDPGGIDVLAASEAEFRAALVAENHTLKRALTDPGVFSGIGNAYSNEILHAAQVSPLAQTQKLKAEEWARLFAAARGTLKLWIDRLVGEAGTGFPEKVTAFRADMAVHGRYGKPCPVCGEKVQRIRYADNETNYCARC